MKHPRERAARADFNPLSPHGERLKAVIYARYSSEFQSTLPAWGETGKTPDQLRRMAISIHSPRMGRDHPRSGKWSPEALFQSTLPAWGETCSPAPARRARRFQSTLPAWGETGPRDLRGGASTISIHSPRMGRDLAGAAFRHILGRFQSTLPAWGETCGEHRAGQEGVYFNPLSPHGERPSSRGSTRSGPMNFYPLSPHGERRCAGDQAGVDDDFNPLSPHGERQILWKKWAGAPRFQSTLPAWGETKWKTITLDGDSLFQSTLPAWGETEATENIHSFIPFQSTLPAWGETAASFPYATPC